MPMMCPFFTSSIRNEVLNAYHTHTRAAHSCDEITLNSGFLPPFNINFNTERLDFFLIHYFNFILFELLPKGDAEREDRIVNKELIDL